MAKKIKFALKMKDGAEVRNIESLREHFDADTVVGYFLDGRLLTWLGNFYYDTEADLVEKLDKNDGQLKKKLCEIFDVEYEDDGEFDVELAAKRREKLEKLKQYTADEKILALVDNVAFDRNDMVELLDEDVDTIVLVDGTYRIPMREHNKKYIGVGNVVAEINSKEVVDFDEIGIKFENIRFDDEYAALLNVNPVEDFRRLYDEAKEADDGEKMLKYALKCAEAGEADMMIVVGDEYFCRDEEEKAFEWYMKAAQKNNTDGMFCVGECYSGGMGVEADEAKAVEWYKKGADLQDVYCVNALAKCYRNGIGVPINIDQAIDLYNSILYNGVANKELGDIYRLEDGYIDYEKAIQCYLKAVEIDESDGYSMNAIGLLLDDEHESFEWFLKSAEAGYSCGMYNVADGYYYGKGVDTDYTEAIEWYEKAAEAGIADAMVKIGDMYLMGDGVNVDEEEAAVWYKRAIEAGDTSGEAYWGMGVLSNSEWDKLQNFKKSAEAGYAPGMCGLGNCYLNGEGTNLDENNGVYWLGKAADGGYTSAIRDLGQYYRRKEQYDQAFQYFYMGAEKDDADCMLWLGLLYDWGQGVAADKAQGEKWYRKAGENGSVKGATNYASSMYYSGNYDTAFQWVVKALQLNPDFARAQCLLGKLYCEGKGVNQDIETGKDWLKKAADNGSEEAQKALEDINNGTYTAYETTSGCFITTAVCGTFNKPDDCYELTSFRNFRDNWLINQPDGASLVQEYYRIAPGIVERINALADAKNIYMSIWQEYLKPCLSCIENGNMQKCKEIYVDMVRNLQKKF
ncbi:MAG: CFI-box-CTERM domain-containing protein [Anaerovibrio sp.]